MPPITVVHGPFTAEKPADRVGGGPDGLSVWWYETTDFGEQTHEIVDQPGWGAMMRIIGRPMLRSFSYSPLGHVFSDAPCVRQRAGGSARGSAL